MRDSLPMTSRATASSSPTGSPAAVRLAALASRPPPDPVRVITDTGELRWFAPGRPPADVLAWFNPGVGRGAVERRSDTYRLDGRTDAGLKLRRGRILDLKVRQSVEDEALSLCDTLGGRLEGWRRWSPADGLVELDADDRWIDITKTIVKRRFLDDGVEVSVEPEPPQDAFCDIEIVALGLGGVRCWSIGIAAYDEPERWRRLVDVAWQRVVATGRFPHENVARLSASCSYPTWLATTASRVRPPAAVSAMAGR